MMQICKSLSKAELIKGGVGAEGVQGVQGQECAMCIVSMLCCATCARSVGTPRFQGVTSDSQNLASCILTPISPSLSRRIYTAKFTLLAIRDFLNTFSSRDT